MKNYIKILNPYIPDKESKTVIADVDRLHLIELLSNGNDVTNEIYSKDIISKMQASGVDSSIQVLILKMIENPTSEPKMTKLAPIVNALFPEVKEVIVNSYSESADQTEWTHAANDKILKLFGDNISDQARRDIIQALMTYYLMIELNRIDVLEDWCQKGGLA